MPTETRNPFFSDWRTPFGAPPFGRLRTAHFLPAFERAISEHREEVATIACGADPPSFANTVEALERSGRLLRKVRSVVMNLNSAHTSDELRAIVREMAPRLAAHWDDILLDEALFARVVAVWGKREALELNPEQRMLLEETRLRFIRGGACLTDESKQRLRQIHEALSRLTVRFGENLQQEMNAPALVLEESELVGLPADVRAAAARVAADSGHAGKWAVTLQRTSWTPFLTYSPRRDLRERLYRAYTNLCARRSERDNTVLAARIAALRVERARLLGYASHAHFVLEHAMAQAPDRVEDLLDRVWKPALIRARAEAADLQAMIESLGDDFELAPWDWWYYAEKLRAATYAFDAEAVNAYFELENVREGAFEVARRLFGLGFEERPDVPVYHEDVRAFAVRDADGEHLGLLFVDYFTRPSKRGGAWMSNYREQRKIDGENVRPIVVNVCNFAKPADEAPALLSRDEVRTLFHEFGHALHGLLANGTYGSLTGTNVYRDFLELPSQMMENWAMHPDVLPTYARHCQTGEPIPRQLIDKLQRSQQFNLGFETSEYVAASMLDMAWHTLTSTEERDGRELETRLLAEAGAIPQIGPRYRSSYFSHIFAGGYAAGYYSYLWAEVLEADAFEAFRRRGIFDAELAAAYRREILERGGSEPPMTLYLRFRGREPSVRPLLERRGLTARPAP